MKQLTVLYDDSCNFCVKCRWWLAAQPAYVDLEFLPARGWDAIGRYPDLHGAAEELTVIDDTGGVYRGPDAWLMTLWALKEYRELSLRLASPALRPLARRIFIMVSSQRRLLSRFIAPDPEALIRSAEQAG